MKKDEGVATERLLEVIRGQAVGAGGARKADVALGARMSDPSGAPEPVAGVLLTPPLGPRSWLAGRVRVGLDVGTHTVKMVRAERSPGGLRLLQAGLASVRPRGEGPEARLSAQVQAVKDLLRDLPGRREPVVTALGDPGVIVRQITLPRMPAKDLARTIPFEARKHMPYDPASVTVRYQVTREGRRGATSEVLLVGVPNRALEAHRSVLQRAGIEPYAIEVGALALVNAFLQVSRPCAEAVVLVDVGAARTVIGIQRDGGALFLRHLTLGGEALTREIQSRLGLPWEAAEEVKQGRAVEGAAHAQGVRDLVDEAMHALLRELRRSLVYYDNMSGRNGFSRILLNGGGALLEGLPAFLEENLGLPVAMMDPFQPFHGGTEAVSGGELERLRPMWTVAVGLATRR